MSKFLTANNFDPNEMKFPSKFIALNLIHPDLLPLFENPKHSTLDVPEYHSHLMTSVL